MYLTFGFVYIECLVRLYELVFELFALARWINFFFINSTLGTNLVKNTFFFQVLFSVFTPTPAA